jgi:uncharacterized protein
LWLLIAMTVAGSLLGAWLLLVVPSKTMPLVIAAALIVVTFFSLTNPKAGLTTAASLVATLVFAGDGLVDWRLGLILGVASFAGGLLGAVLANRVSNLWLRRIFVTAVIVMALKTLLLDVPWANL